MVSLKASAIKVLLNIFLVIGIFVIVIYYVSIINILAAKPFTRNNTINVDFVASTKIYAVDDYQEDLNVWLIFTKVSNRSPLKYKFNNLLINLLNVSSVPLKFNIIVDSSSRHISDIQISHVINRTHKVFNYTYYDFNQCAAKLKDIVEVMTPHFSSKPGTYYSDALFYISLALHRIAPDSQEKAILLDCDLYFKKDILYLFRQFEIFKPTALYGLAPELSPVYWHILHTYRSKHNTTFGMYYHSKNISEQPHRRGFQGYNSGVVLLDLKAIRTSHEFKHIIKNETVQYLTKKYKFHGNLGDQDFYTLAGYEYPHLFETLHCGFNRQLCVWWRDHGYNDIFYSYFQCNHSIHVLHGNCNTKVPAASIL